MARSRSEVVVSDPSGETQHELEHLQSNWWWFVLLGALLIVCGIVAIGYPYVTAVTSVAIVMALGIVLLIAGIALIVTSFWTGTWSAFLIQLLIGILYLVVGLLTVEHPGEATGAVTLLIAAMFIVAGIFRMVAAIALRFPQWGWVLLNGFVALVLGIIVYKQFPDSALWLIGLLFGVDLLFNGITWVMLGIEVRDTRVTDVTEGADA